MGLLATLTKVGLAKKVYEEARKPENRRKLKQLWSKITNRSKGQAA